MNYEEAKLLQQQVKRRKECNSLLEELCQQKKEHTPIVNELEKSNKKEQENLKKLQRVSFTSVFYNLTGKKEEKLNKKRQEAITIKVKYESAVKKMEDIEEEIRKVEEELSQIMGSEAQFYTYLEENYEFLKTKKPSDFSKIMKIEQEEKELEDKLLLTEETIKLGKDVEWDIHNMFIILDIAVNTKAEIRASQVGSVAKLYEYIDKAQTSVVKLQDKLTLFNKKLEELSIDRDINLDIEAFMHILDVPMTAMLSDNMSMYFSIIDKVAIVSNGFQPIKKQVEEIMQNLYVLEMNIKQNIDDKKIELEDTIIELASI